METNKEKELIKKALQIESEEERLKFVMNYFANNVEYNYVCLFVKGYLKGDISIISKNCILKENPFKNNINAAEFIAEQEFIEGESEIFSKILKLRDDNLDNYEEFIKKLDLYITEQLSLHLSNDDLVKKEKNILMKNIIEDMKKNNEFEYEGEKYSYQYDISAVLMNYLLNKKDTFTVEIEDGILKRGVCKDFSVYLEEFLPKIGIKCHRVDGRSEFKHAWNIVKINGEYKSVDLTRTIFIRDGFNGIPQEQKMEDWLYCDLEKMFNMQKTRTIERIDGEDLKEPITSSNYDRKSFEDALNGLNKMDLYVQSEDRVYDSELFKEWHNIYLRSLQEHSEEKNKEEDGIEI